MPEDILRTMKILAAVVGAFLCEIVFVWLLITEALGIEIEDEAGGFFMVSFFTLIITLGLGMAVYEGIKK